MASPNKEVAYEILPVIRIFTDGTAERLEDFPFAPPTPEADPSTGVLSKDVVVSEFSVRIYLPPNTQENTKLPILIYFHGGGFCFESAFSLIHHRFLNTLVSVSNVILVNVEYRQAPEHLLPTAYNDSWTSLQWVASKSDPWLEKHGDFSRIFLGGDSAGGNIVNHLLLRAGKEEIHDNLKIVGGFINHPHFWGSVPIGSEGDKIKDREMTLAYRCWMLSYPNVEGGIDSPMVNPLMDKGSLRGLACRRILVNVAEYDDVRDRGVAYGEAVKESGWEGEIEVVEDLGENHYFHLILHGSEKSMAVVNRLTSFINK